MYNYTVQINQEVENKIKNLIDDYWLFTNNEFEYSLNHLVDKYELTVPEITKLIKKHSICNVLTDCTNCSKVFPRLVNTKGFFKISKYHSVLCPECEEKQNRLIQERKQKQEEEYRKKLEANKKIEEEKDKMFLKAIQTRQWMDLNAYEKDVLIKIIESNGIKKNVRDVVFNGDFYNKYIWGILKNSKKRG